MSEQAIAESVETTLQQILKQLADLSERVAQVEQARAAEPAPPLAAPPAAPEAKAISPVAVEAGISESELLAISAALAAYLGVRPDIRQIRLIGSNAWSLYGRASIQASHRPKR